MLTSTFVLHGWCGRSRTYSHPLSFCMAGVAGVAGVALGHIHLRFAWQAWRLSYRAGSWSPHAIFHTPSLSHTTFTHNLCHTPSFTQHLCHAPSFAHNFVTHTIFHTLSFTVLVSCSSALVVLAQAEIADNKPACSSIVSPVEVAVALRNVSVTRPV